MGTGTPEAVECVARGIDMFDCVMPTRNARNGQLFTSEGRINIRNARYAEDDRPLDPACGCYACRHHSGVSTASLPRGNVAGALNTLHNLSFYLDTMRRIRDAIAFRTFDHSGGGSFTRLPACRSIHDQFEHPDSPGRPGGSANPWLQFVPFIHSCSPSSTSSSCCR